MSKDYVCAACGGKFTSDSTHEEARGEALALFGEDPDDGNMEVVCDKCFQEMTQAIPPEEWK